jgi:MFS family permease
LPRQDSRTGRKFGLLMWFLILASASITAMFWTEDPGPLTLNVAGRAASAAGFVAVYVWSTELLPTSVRSGGMGLGSTAARVGSVAAPWAAQLGDLLPIPESLANDLPLALFGGQKEKRSISFASFDALKNASSFDQDRLGTNIVT